ncbi:MAG: hypothetical protein A2293_07790 [Elusimicrobia bacterium RIFOXYB2_FULL_49_7]|nr:MAG: hypothetical protein A2293_07790 [Elusimicrobia bacterium RIFOXYB2_FULL_49_7]
MTQYLVTGAAGFIGFHLSKHLLSRGDQVVGFDNLNPYYDPTLKEARLKILFALPGFKFVKGDLADEAAVEKLFKEEMFSKVCHLAAQAGVRYSIENPRAYLLSNEVGFFNMIDCAKRYQKENFVYASSSSVYGSNKKSPFSVFDPVDHPISLYAATKKANELVAHSYSHLFGLRTTGLRFFTVYGPYGRPDMALFKFAKAILEDKAIEVYNHGKMKRDFTFVEDIVSGIVSSLDHNYAYEVFNLGNNRPVQLTYFVECIEKALGKKAKQTLLPMQAGDVAETCADIDYSKEKLGYEPKTPIEQGIEKFIAWYRQYYHI